MYIGLAEAFWPGRSHCIERDDITFYLDGAHTRKSIEVMCLSCIVIIHNFHYVKELSNKSIFKKNGI
jgi:folylpolyglutamate synthase/dihydropteroate synthase